MSNFFSSGTRLMALAASLVFVGSALASMVPANNAQEIENASKLTTLVVVKEGSDVADCGRDVQQTGASMDFAGATIGILVVQANGTQTAAIEALACVLSVELEGEPMTGGGIAGAMN